MRDDPRDLAILLGYSVVAAAAAWLFSPEGLVGLLVAPLLVACPGYALVRAIEGPRHVDALELAMTTVALSFATVVLGGLALNALDVPLAARGWSALLVGTTAAGVAIAIERAPGAVAASPRRTLSLGPAPVLAAVAICGLLLAAAVLAHRSETSLDRRTSTPSLGAVPSADGSTLNISVGNGESAPADYRVRIESGGGSTNLQLTLRPGEDWSSTQVVPGGPSAQVRVQLLSVAPQQTVLRTVTLNE